MPEVSTPVGMVGYSGGSTATEFASELAHTYAPDLDIVGVAEGGIPVDPFHNLTYVDRPGYQGRAFNGQEDLLPDMRPGRGASTPFTFSMRGSYAESRSPGSQVRHRVQRDQAAVGRHPYLSRRRKRASACDGLPSRVAQPLPAVSSRWLN